jgi:hypothetical protein
MEIKVNLEARGAKHIPLPQDWRNKTVHFRFLTKDGGFENEPCQNATSVFLSNDTDDKISILLRAT